MEDWLSDPREPRQLNQCNSSLPRLPVPELLEGAGSTACLQTQPAGFTACDAYRSARERYKGRDYQQVQEQAMNLLYGLDHWVIGCEASLILQGIEELCIEREELNKQIQQEEEEKSKLQNDIHLLTDELARVNETLVSKMASRNFDKAITDTEAAYTKILESSQMLLTVLKKEAGNLSLVTESKAP